MATAARNIDPRVKRTRKLLQQAFMELFREKGFASISIQDITERATVNRATFYAHFTDKYDLMDSIIREEFQRTVAEQLPPNPGWNITSLRALIRATFGFLDQFHHGCKPTNTAFPLMERAIQQELADILLDWLKQAPAGNAASISAGRRVPAKTLASVLSWAIFGMAVQWSHSERTASAEEMTNQVLPVLTEGATRLAPGLSPE